MCDELQVPERYVLLCLDTIASLELNVLLGVVDGRLIVYDTKNVRVVDASIMPLQISAHLSSTVYGIAEKAADIIKAAQ